MGVGVENLDAGLGGQGQVFDADAGVAGELDARLDNLLVDE